MTKWLKLVNRFCEVCQSVHLHDWGVNGGHKVVRCLRCDCETEV